MSSPSANGSRAPSSPQPSNASSASEKSQGGLLPSASSSALPGSLGMRRTDSTSSLPGSSGLSKQWPHLYHYVSHLLAAAAAQEVSRPAASAALAPGSAWPTAASLQQQQQQPTSQLAQHPLSVSSSGSGSSSEEDSDKDRPASTSARKHSTADSQRSEASSSSRSPKPASSVTSTSENASVVSSRKSPRSAFAPVAAAAAVGGAAPPGLSRTISSSSSIRSTGPPSPLIPTGVTPPAKAVSQSEKEELLKKVIDLLENEREEECKKVIEDALGQMGKDAVMVDQICLDLMHKHKDDVDQVPYQPTLTSMRSRASPSISHAQPISRPFTPTRVPSFRARTPLGRPQSPVPAHNAGVIGQGSPNHTPTHSAPGTPTYGMVNSGAGTAASAFLGGFTLSGPTSSSSQGGLLGGASPMRPPQALPGGGSPLSSPSLAHAKPTLMGGLPSPFAAGSTDPWAQIGQSASPVGTPSGIPRSSSNLVVAPPVTADDIANTGTSKRVMGEDRDAGVDDIFSAGNQDMVQRSTSYLPEEDEDDEFSPFATPKSSLSTSPTNKKLQVTAKSFDPSRLGSSVLGHPGATSDFVPGGGGASANHGDADDHAQGNQQGEGMTPLDVLQSVFTTLPPGELEEALMQSGYDFEGAMALLIAKHGGVRPAVENSFHGPPRHASPALRPPAFNRVPSGRGEYFTAGGRSGFGGSPGGMGNGHISPRFVSGTRSPIPANLPGGLRICRYYLAGECRRADCRFSHDVDRALCRFWLKGNCAKGENCEFIHALPSVDPNVLSNAMSRIELNADGSSSRSATTPVDEFPDLQTGLRHRPGFDPTRNRFANAVKRPPPTQGFPAAQLAANRFAPTVGSQQRRFVPGAAARHVPTVPVPRPSPRIKLRPPTLLPTLATGASANDMYMDARQNAIRLGQARNACLARAADAWRRGDGASAKRFSREANVLNEKMTAEGAEAAAKLVRQRRAMAQEAIRARGDWSDDPGDRAAKGKECGGGLGVIMGIASAKALGPGGDALTQAERTECLADLHTLHGDEGVDVLEEFLLALERERFVGLAYVIIGEERHTGTQDTGRGASRYRLSTAVKQFLARYSYPWSEGGGCICIDAAVHS